MPSVVALNGANEPVAKRQRRSSHKVNSENKSPPSRIFAPFRTVGLVSPTEVPFTSIPLGKTTFQITTCVGRSLQTYDLRRGLQLVFITRPQTPEQITASASWDKKVLAAWGSSTSREVGVWVYQRGKKVGELEMPLGLEETICQLSLVGSWIVGRCATRIEVWKSSTLQHYTTLTSPYGGLTRDGKLYSGGMCHMPTFLNKIFVGRCDGGVEIWNVSTGKHVFTLAPPSADTGPVTTLQPAPALSLLAIAFESGSVVIQDVRTDKQLFHFNRDGGGLPVSSISFRTDGLGAGEDGRKDGVMATTSSLTGDVSFWDLNDGGKKIGVLYGAHNPASSARGGSAGGITRAEFLPGQAILVTSGLDNSLKSWIFDDSPFSPIPRILHTRAGHAAPVSSLQFLPSQSDGADDVGKWLLSASQDRSLWGWSLRRDGQSTELSQGRIQKKAKQKGLLNGSLASLNGTQDTIESLKAPKITSMACSLNRDGGIGALPGNQPFWVNHKKQKLKSSAADSAITGWESVITGHEGDKVARTWFWGRKRAGRWAFETGDGGIVTSVAISPCGTFALIGSSFGGIDMFNLQSGVHRQRFPPRLTQKQANQIKLQQLETGPEESVNDSKKYARGQGKHSAAVTGLVVDNLNQIVISTGADGKIKFWNFNSGLLLNELNWLEQTSVTQVQFHRSSDLLALACTDNRIRVLDFTTRKTVRELLVPKLFNLDKASILDMIITPSSRWLVASISSSVLLTWDLPTAHLIDAVKLPSPATSIAFAPTEEFLATAHPDSVGVALWTNRTLFSHVPVHRIKDAQLTKLTMAAAPTASGEGGQNIITTTDDAEAEEDELAPSMKPANPDDLTDNLATLSLIPRPRTQTLRHIDAVRARNKPIEPPKKPERAPFFLPSLPDPGSGVSNPASNGTTVPDSKQSTTSGTKGSSSLPPSRFLRLTSKVSSTASLDAAALIDHMITLPPSQADYFIRSLEARAPYTELTSFVRAMSQRLRDRKDYEAVQVWMGRFLEIWAEVILQARGEGESEEDPWEGMSVDGEQEDESESNEMELINALQEWQAIQEAESKRLEDLVGYCKGILGFLRGI